MTKVKERCEGTWEGNGEDPHFLSEHRDNAGSMAGIFCQRGHCYLVVYSCTIDECEER